MWVGVVVVVEMEERRVKVNEGVWGGGMEERRVKVNEGGGGRWRRGG